MPTDPEAGMSVGTYWLTYQDPLNRQLLLTSRDKNLLIRRGYELALISGSTLLLWEQGAMCAQIIWVIRGGQQRS